MLNRESIIYGAQLAFLDLAEKIYDRQVEGDDIEQLERKLILVHNYLLVLQNSPGQKNEDFILDCLQKQLSLYDLPIAKPLRTLDAPAIIVGTRDTQVISGPPGRDGDNASITVEAEGAYASVREEGDSTHKTYFVSLIPYTAPVASLLVKGALDNRKVFEIGESVQVQVIVNTIEGSSSVISRELDDGTVLIDLENLVGEEIILLNDITESTTYSLFVDDSEQVLTIEDSIEFYRPFIYGSGASIDYSANRVITEKTNLEVNFNGTYTKFHFGFPTEYGELTRILDQDDNDITSSFEINEVAITSNIHGTLDWTHTYKVYSTIDVTDIDNKTYKFIF